VWRRLGLADAIRRVTLAPRACPTFAQAYGDDSQSFSSPLVADRTLAFSQVTLSGLPTTRMWWRVRANDGAGAPGAWSAARRFELKG
jgi:hypothetical protein